MQNIAIANNYENKSFKSKIIYTIKMAKFMTKVMPQLSKKYLIFIIIIIFGCSYQTIQVTKVFLDFEKRY